ncbi:TPA: hypothetical protein ACJIWU_002624 [Enterobacter chengduensis]|uniref:Membrane protein n=1 Tax=Enterobacter chengduensis TaxID=2494701 RepID=A0AAW3HL61_9ENTR|nr:hypothetical protein [Enterobacter chengduensis]KDF48715.1 hypothetical protein AE07_01631 [Enterobacter cloacae BWH 43]GJL39272.1 hypothetical protein TUM17577_04810 [Enterobacter asburiae]KJX38458.1 membrane protein [Enterobacter chengduensis]MBN9878696.1 hypothetical protein [Enterobacter chengduensis]MBT1932151.1 hypothetical protein [Enterobacter chengduensis]
MEILIRNKFSSVGMLLGVIALLLSLVQFTLGPFSSKSTVLEVVVAEKVSAVKKGILAGIKGEQPIVETKKEPVYIDRLLIASGIMLSVMALGLAFISGLRKENKWTVSGALFFSGATIAFHAALLAFGLVAAILLLMLVVSIISGSTLF